MKHIRCMTDPIMSSNVFFLFPLSMWLYIGFYGYTLQYVLLLCSSYMYHRSYETRYFWLDVFFGSSSIMYAIIDNWTIYDDYYTWVAILSTLCYYGIMCTICGVSTRCCKYTVVHTGWHAWVCGSSCIWAYASGKYVGVF